MVRICVNTLRRAISANNNAISTRDQSHCMSRRDDQNSPSSSRHHALRCVRYTIHCSSCKKKNMITIGRHQQIAKIQCKPLTVLRTHTTIVTTPKRRDMTGRFSVDAEHVRHLPHRLTGGRQPQRKRGSANNFEVRLL